MMLLDVVVTILLNSLKLRNLPQIFERCQRATECFRCWPLPTKQIVASCFSFQIAASQCEGRQEIFSAAVTFSLNLEKEKSNAVSEKGYIKTKTSDYLTSSTDITLNKSQRVLLEGWNFECLDSPPGATHRAAARYLAASRGTIQQMTKGGSLSRSYVLLSASI